MADRTVARWRCFAGCIGREVQCRSRCDLAALDEPRHHRNEGVLSVRPSSTCRACREGCSRGRLGSRPPAHDPHRLDGTLAAMTEAGDGRGAAYVSGRLVSTLETIARVTGELGSMAQSINVTNNLTVLAEHPAFLQVQATMLRALATFPDARASVVAALRELDVETLPAALPSPVSGRVIEHAA